MLRSGDRIDSFTLVREIGKGSFGVVWLAEERTKLARAPKVALKIAFEDRVEISEIEREAELWVEASGHVNVLPILSVRFHDDQIIIVSEYAPDGSLDQWLSRHDGKAPSTESSVDLMLGILAGLEHFIQEGLFIET